MTGVQTLLFRSCFIAAHVWRTLFHGTCRGRHQKHRATCNTLENSTRLILTKEGQAGKIIETFGSFVLQGNIVVGTIIFIIIVLVQFIVIAKGAERVAEVAARFTLDAMPGKQMAIDADLSSGLITEDEARLRKHKVQKESDFYGAIDGATKIVKGDAIMSIIITLINFIAGSIIGSAQMGKSFSEVLKIYSKIGCKMVGGRR